MKFNLQDLPHSTQTMEASSEEDLELRFQRAAARMRNNTSLRLSNDQKLLLYGYFKQANEGPCNTPKPGFFDFTGRAKWEAWNKLGDLARMEAMEKYLALVDSLDPNWEQQPADTTTSAAYVFGHENPLASYPDCFSPPTWLGYKARDTPAFNLLIEDRSGGQNIRPATIHFFKQHPAARSGGTTMGGPVMSRAVEKKEDLIPDELKTVFDWCKEGHVTNLAAMVTAENINETCDNGLTLLHWACDRGHLEVVKFLVGSGADINIQDPDQQTPLHYAASCDHQGVVSHLLSAAANRSIKDCDGYLAEERATEPTTRLLFQKQS